MAELHIDRDLQAGIELLEKGEKIDKALKLINKSARKGISKGKSFFEVGRIIREGVSGIEPSVAESRHYFDEAMVHFLNEQPNDALDYREMGDYYHYGLGSEPINREKAREYYNLALQLGDTQSETRLSQIEEEIENGTTEISPEISKDTHAPETKVNEQSEVKEVVKESDNPQVAVSQEDKKAEKILKAVSTYPFEVFSNQTVTRGGSHGEREVINVILLDNTKILANACCLGNIGYRIGIEIKEDGTVTVNTPIAAENSYKISDPYDPFANIMFDTLDELKRGEHLEAQCDEDSLKDPDIRAMCFMMSKETYKKLYLQIISGLIFVCMDVNIKEEDFEKGWVSEMILEAVTKVEQGAFGIREVTGVHKQYW